eukprot:scaffold221035_cov22-Tisochrysis_lutea.AAC.1
MHIRHQAASLRSGREARRFVWGSDVSASFGCSRRCHIGALSRKPPPDFRKKYKWLKSGEHATSS